MRIKALLTSLFIFFLQVPFALADDDHSWLFNGSGRSHRSGPMDEETFFYGLAFLGVGFLGAAVAIFFVQKILFALFASASFLKFIPLAPLLLIIGGFPPCGVAFMAGRDTGADDPLGTLSFIMLALLILFLYFYLLALLFDLFSNKPYMTYMNRVLVVAAVLFGLIALLKGLYLVVLLLALMVVISHLAEKSYRKVKGKLQTK